MNRIQSQVDAISSAMYVIQISLIFLTTPAKVIFKCYNVILHFYLD